MSRCLLLASCLLSGSLLGAPVWVSAQRNSADAVLEAPRVGLQVVPLPRLDDLELPVADHLRDVERRFREAADRGGLSDGDLAEAYGSVGRAFHAYEIFDSAETAYLNALRLRPDESRWLHLLGYLYQQTGRLEESADRFASARRAQPNDYAAAVRLGDVYLGLNRLREAREQFQSVLMTFPALASRGLGEVALRSGRFDEALAYFRTALERVPQASSIHYSLAMAYRGLGRLDQARSHLQQRGGGGIRVVDPVVDDLQTLVRGERLLVIQGRRAYEAGQFQEAVDAFTRAVTVAPDSVSSRVNLASALLKTGDVPAALEQLRVAFARTPDDSSVSSALIGVLLRVGREDEAIDVQMKARSRNPDDEDGLVSLSILLAHRERYGEAVALLEDGHRRFPDRTTTATTLARLLSSSPDLSLRDGRRALELAMAVYASSPSPTASETVALALAETGRCDQAMDWMRRAVAEAERVQDAEETARLKGELPRFGLASCRAPGR